MGSKVILATLLASVALLQTAAAGEQKLGDYLAGRAAQRQNDWVTASGAMVRALNAAPPDAELRHNTLLLAIAAGDIATAARIAATTPPGSNDSPIAALTLAVFKLGKGDIAGATKATDAMPSAGVTHLARPLLAARFAAARGDLKAARADPMFEIDPTRDLGELEAARLDDKLSPARAIARGPQRICWFP